MPLVVSSEFECSTVEVHRAPQLRWEELVEAAKSDATYPTSKPEPREEWRKEEGLWTLKQLERKCVWVPDNAEVRMKLISESHETPLAGHFGIKKTMERLRDRVRWAGMRKEVQDFVRIYDLYQRARDKLSDNVNVHTIIARHPWEIVTIDFICGFASARQTKHTSVVVITDKFTRQVHLRSCPPQPIFQRDSPVFPGNGGSSSWTPSPNHQR